MSINQYRSEASTALRHLFHAHMELAETLTNEFAASEYLSARQVADAAISLDPSDQLWVNRCNLALALMKQAMVLAVMLPA